MENMVGVQRYTYQILKEVDKLLKIKKEKNNIVILVAPENSTWYPDFLNIKIVKKGKITGKTSKYLWQQLVFPLFVRINKGIGIDLAAAFPVWGCDICAIHDCIHEDFPEDFRDHKINLVLYRKRVQAILNNRKVQIVTLSEDSKQDLLGHYKINPNRISIVGCGWEHMQEIEEDDTIFSRIGINPDDKYYFSLGSRYQHKNYQWILKTAAKNPKLKFVITGSDSYSQELKKLKRNQLDNVMYTGYITDGEIKALMKNCVAVIQPSFSEGFGLPPLEALSLGKNAIVSDISVFREIYRNTVFYIDPCSNGCDIQKIYKQQVSPSTSVLKEYTWKNAANQLLKILTDRGGGIDIF